MSKQTKAEARTMAHTVTVTIKVDGELECEYERAMLTEAEARDLVGKVQQAVLNVPNMAGMGVREE